MTLSRDLRLVLATAFLRAFGIGLTGVVLGIYLARAGFPATLIGLVLGAGFAGIAVGTLVVGLKSDRLGRRRTFVLLAACTAVGGMGMALATRPFLVLSAAFVGMINGMGRDRGAALALEQAVIAQMAANGNRTWLLAWYNVVMDGGHALGALAGVLPYILRRWWHVDELPSYQLTFGLYAALSVTGCLAYLFLSPDVEIGRTNVQPPSDGRGVSKSSRKIVRKLAALFSLDGLGGGFLTGALLGYWFFRRFGITEGGLGPLFFAAGALSAASYPFAAWLARKIGLLNTMVFTHIPSSLFLVALPFAPTLSAAVALFLARACLVEMDVPTRQSYTMAIVHPQERTYASGVTNLTRNLAWAGGSSVAGYVMENWSLAAPLYFAAGLKLAYDALLYVAFRRLRPPEERSASSATIS